MLFIILFILELIVLFIVSRKLQKKLGMKLYNLIRNKKITIYIISLLFLPGTLIHEMAHFLSALILFVPAGKIELIPKIEKDGIKLGSVEIGRSDLIRRFIISTAPFVAGTFFIIGIFYNLPVLFLKNPYYLIITAYFIFTVSNMMFISKKDMEGVWGFIILAVIIVFLLYLFNIKINLNFINFEKLENSLSRADMFLFIPIILDIIALNVLRIF